MSEVSTIPVVTCPDGRWRGDWSDGYTAIVTDLDDMRVGVYRTVLDVHYHESYVTTLSVDLLSPRSREEFAVTLAARNGAHPVLWDGRLGHFYHTLEEKRRGEQKENAWAPIQSLPGLLPEVPAFAEELLPKALQALALDIAERMQVPLDYIAIPLIVTAGAVIGRQCGILPKRHDDWLVIPNLWGAVVGRPGLMKSPALTQALKPMERLAAQAIEADEERTRQQATTRDILDAQLTGVKEALKKAAKGGKADEIATHTAQIEELQAQVEALTVTVRRYKTNDATIQKLGELLRDNPTGMLLYRDELSGWLSSLRQDGREGDREFFLEAWNGDGGYTFDRIGRGMVHVEGLCLSIVGGIQPGKLARYVYDTCEGGTGDDGLLQRFQLLVWPSHDADFVNIDRAPDSTARKRVYDLYARLADLDAEAPGATVDKYQTIPALRFTPEAQDLFDAWRVELENRVRAEQSPAFESHLAKYRSLMPTLALIFHLIDAMMGEAVTTAVSLNAAQLGADWCDFLEAHARKVYAGVLHKDLQAAHALAEKIRSGALTSGQTVREVYRNAWALLQTPDDVYGGLRYLERCGWVRLTEGAHHHERRAPTRDYRVQPRPQYHTHGVGFVSFVSGGGGYALLRIFRAARARA
jgi:Protein of unknown function (DUF3987)